MQVDLFCIRCYAGPSVSQSLSHHSRDEAVLDSCQRAAKAREFNITMSFPKNCLLSISGPGSHRQRLETTTRQSIGRK